VNIDDMKGYNKNKNILLEYQTWDETRNNFKNNIIPFQFPLKDKYMIMSLLGHTSDTLENYELRLGNYGMTLTNKYVLDKGKNGKKYKNIFHIENILERMDISPTNIWKNKNRKTRKRNKQENSL
jgi:hypothetical protein